MDPEAIYPSVSGGLLFGTLETLTPKNPAAATDLDLQLGQGYWTRVITSRFTLTTDATAGNRFVAVDITDGTNVIFIARAGTGQTPSSTMDYGVYRLGQISQSANAQVCNLPLPDAWIPAGGHIKTVTVGMGAGDQFSNFAFYVERVSVDNMRSYYEAWGLDVDKYLAPHQTLGG